MYTRVTLFSVQSIVVLHIKSSIKSQYAVDRKDKKEKTKPMENEIFVMETKIGDICKDKKKNTEVVFFLLEITKIFINRILIK